MGGSNSGWATNSATPDARNLYSETRHQQVFRDAGCLLGHYWANGVHGTPDQVADFIVATGQVRPGETFWWDVEPFTNASGAIWTPAQLEAYVDAYERRGKPRSEQGVYLNQSLANGGRGDYRTAGLSRLWLAHYTTAATTSVRGWPGVELWQYTDTGRLPGYAGNLDLNRAAAGVVRVD